MLDVPTPQTFLYYSDEFKFRTKSSGYLLEKIVTAEVTIILLVSSVRTAKYQVTNILLPCRL